MKEFALKITLSKIVSQIQVSVQTELNGIFRAYSIVHHVSHKLVCCEKLFCSPCFPNRAGTIFEPCHSTLLISSPALSDQPVIWRLRHNKYICAGIDEGCVGERLQKKSYFYVQDEKFTKFFDFSSGAGRRERLIKRLIKVSSHCLQLEHLFLWTSLSQQSEN